MSLSPKQKSKVVRAVLQSSGILATPAFFSIIPKFGFHVVGTRWWLEFQSLYSMLQGRAGMDGEEVTENIALF